MNFMRKNKFMKKFAMIAVAIMMLCPTSADFSWAVEADANPAPAVEDQVTPDEGAIVDEEQTQESTEPGVEESDEVTGDEFQLEEEEEVVTDDALLGTEGAALSGNVAAQNLSGNYYLSGNVTLTGNLTVSSGATAKIDLNGYELKVNGHSIVNNGTLTIVGNAGNDSTSNVARSYGNEATYSNNTLTYYVTTTTVTDKSTGATSEQVVKHVVTNMGRIAGGSASAIKNTGTLNLNGGYICGGSANAVDSTGGTVNLQGAVIAGVTTNAIKVSAGTLNLNSGVISGNKAGQGAAITASGTAKINMPSGSTAYITNNHSTSTSWGNGGGAIYLTGKNVKLTMGNAERPTAQNGVYTGGYVTGNKSEGGGGGIFANSSATIIMNGGFVTANQSVRHEGGGINLHNGAYLQMQGGYVTNNILGGVNRDSSDTKNFYDWGGGGIFCSDSSGSTVKLLDTLITNNDADGFGGGVAGCSTGRVTIVDHAAIFDNEAKGTHISGSSSSKHEDHQYAAEDPVFMENGYDDFFCALSSTVSSVMLGGGYANWSGSVDGTPVSVTGDQTISAGYVIGLTANPDNSAKSNAKNAATAFLTGNFSATHGGGILANGYLIVGDTDEIDVNMPLEVEGTKALLGVDGKTKSLTPGAFEFEIREDSLDNEPITTGTNDATGKIVFANKLSFKVSDKDAQGNAKNNYRFIISEKVGNDTSIEYTPAIYVMDITTKITNGTISSGATTITKHVKEMTGITITRYDNGVIEGQGTQVYKTTNITNDEKHGILFSNLPEVGGKKPGAAVRFENKEITPGEIVLTAHKTLEGASLDDYTFNFTLNGSGVNETKSNDGEGEVTFSPIKYNAVGTYEYTITETVENPDGHIVYDHTAYRAIVTVTKDGSTLKASVVYKKGDDTVNKPEFTNKYQLKPTSVAPVAKKTLEGKNLVANQFEFTLTGEGQNQTIKNDGNGDVKFNTINFTEAGDYSYEVREKITTEDGNYTYDHSVYTMKVKVVDNNGQLVATPSYEKDGKSADKMTFANKYEPTKTSFALDAQKTLAGKNLVENQFEFQLIGADNKVIESVKNDGNGKVQFSEIEYTKAGTYTYTVKEYVQTKDKHYTYDETVYTATVTVEDKDGQLVATPSYKAGADSVNKMIFSNTYTPDGTTASMEARKSLKGKTLEADEFTFTLTGNGVSQTKSNDAQGKVAFDAISYAKAGTYTYTIKETPGQNAHYTYDPKNYKAVVTVEDEDGQLVANVEYQDEDGNKIDEIAPTFKNTYTPEPTSYTFDGDKTLTGIREPEDGEFNFVVTDVTDASAKEVVATGTNKGNVINFTKIDYAKAGTYKYEITEVNGGNSHISYDKTTYHATVNVTVNDKDQLVAALGENDLKDGYAKFVNDFNTDKAKVEVNAHKSMTLRDPKEGEFTFAITEVSDPDDPESVIGDKPVSTGTTDSKGDIKFADLVYDKEGVHHYYIAEVVGDNDKIIYDTTKYHFTVTVALKNDELVATKSNSNIPEGGMEFINKNNPDDTSVDFEAFKSLLGEDGEPALREIKAGEFSFVVTDDDNRDVVVSTGTNDADGVVDFSAINYNEDAIGVHNYTIKEVKGQNEQVTYDDTDYDVEVTVSLGDDDNLKAVAKVTDEEGKVVEPDSIKFDNTLKPGATSLPLYAHKTFTNKKSGEPVELKGGEFEFQLLDSTGKVLDDTYNVVDGDVTFDPISFSEEGTYTYTIKEIPDPDFTEKYHLINYDTVVYNVNVKVTLGADDKLVAEVTNYPTDEQQYADGQYQFHNTYEGNPRNPWAEIEVVAHKNLNAGESGITLKAGMFNFELYEATASGARVEGGARIEATNDADGDVTFDVLRYDKKEQLGDHYYVVREVPGDDEEIYYDPTTYLFKVEVSEFGEDYVAVITEGNPSEADGFKYQFTNNAVAPTETVLEATKAFADTPKLRDPKEGEFKFVVAEQIVNDEGETKFVEIGTAYNDKDGKVSFEPINYTKTSDVGTHTYIIKEVPGRDELVEYDESEYKATVEVALNADNTALVAGEPEYSATPTFVNDLNPAKISVDLEATKLLIDNAENKMDLEEGEFAFIVIDRDQDDLVVSRGTNDKDGNVKFSSIEYDKTQIGVHKYTIAELVGSDEKVTYDDTGYDVTVTIGYEASNDTLTKDVVITDKDGNVVDMAGVVFKNTYTPDPIGAIIEADKELTGRDLKAGEFKFQLLDAETREVVGETTNDANGKIAFKFADNYFNKTGTHNYVIVEVEGEDDNITYDDKEYRVAVEVTLGADRLLKSEVKYLDGKVTFKNKYNPPDEPKTGDHMPIFPLIGLMLASLAGAGFTFFRRRKEA